MKKAKLVSLQCSSESFEKTIALYFYTLGDNIEFYKKYDVYAFYGHNLPKKEKKVSALGTIGFYDRFYGHYNIIKFLNKKKLLQNKEQIINYLLNHKKITFRVSLKFKLDNVLYWNYIEKMPLEFLYPNHVKRIINVASSVLNLNLLPLFLEDNLLEILLNIKSEKDKYSIYALEYNGEVGRYYLNYSNIKSFTHIFNMLNEKSVLSGNSAILLEQILRRSSERYTIGYRKHNHDIRKTRNYALSKILKKNNSIIEPKVYKINELFAKQNDEMSTEEKANRVYADVFYKFLIKYHEKLNFSEIEEDWYETI